MSARDTSPAPYAAVLPSSDAALAKSCRARADATATERAGDDGVVVHPSMLLASYAADDGVAGIMMCMSCLSTLSMSAAMTRACHCASLAASLALCSRAFSSCSFLPRYRRSRRSIDDFHLSSAVAAAACAWPVRVGYGDEAMLLEGGDVGHCGMGMAAAAARLALARAGGGTTETAARVVVTFSRAASSSEIAVLGMSPWCKASVARSSQTASVASVDARMP